MDLKDPVYNDSYSTQDVGYSNVDLLLAHRLRRWRNIRPTSIERLSVCWVFSLIRPIHNAS